MADALLEARAPARTEPIPFERGLKGKLAWETHQATHSAAQNGLEIAASANGVARNDERNAALATVAAAREIVNHLDPLGVGARDLRECLSIQIAALQRESEMVLRRARAQAIRYAGDPTNELAEETFERMDGVGATPILSLIHIYG